MPPSSRQPKPKAKPYSRPAKAGSKPKPTRKKAEYIPYDYPAFPDPLNLRFDSEATWDAEKLVAGIIGVSFGDQFNIKDSHLDALVNSEPGFRSSLIHLSCGNSDNGYGSSISTEVVVRLATACPNLEFVKLESATRVSDTALLALANNCKNIVFIGIMGHDKRTGQISHEALKTIKEDKKIAPKLKHLDLTDQDSYGGKLSKACKALSKARKTLAISEGRTDGDGIAASFIASVAGTEISTTWFGGKEVGGGDSDYGFGGFW